MRPKPDVQVVTDRERDTLTVSLYGENGRRTSVWRYEHRKEAWQEAPPAAVKKVVAAFVRAEILALFEAPKRKRAPAKKAPAK